MQPIADTRMVTRQPTCRACDRDDGKRGCPRSRPSVRDKSPDYPAETGGKASFDRKRNLGDNSNMSVDPKTIALTEAQKRALAELSDKTGKPWADVFTEALSEYRPKAGGNGKNGESFSAAAARLGLIGCIEGPADLSTNPAYMEGFGEREK